MTFAILDWHTVPVAADSWFEVPRRVNELAHDTLSQSPIYHEAAVRRAWEFRTTPMTAATYAKTRALLDGRGQAWSFADGSPRSVTGVGTIYAGSSAAAFGGRLATQQGCLTVDIASTTMTSGRR